MRLISIVLSFVLLVTCFVLAQSTRIGNKTCALSKSGVSYSSVESEEYEHTDGKRELVIICKYGDKITDRSGKFSCGKSPMSYTAAVISGSVLVTVFCER